MLNLEKFISDFGELPTWKKVVLFLPLILVVVALFFVQQRGGGSTDTFIKWNKKKTDKKVNQFEKELKDAERKLESLDSEKKEIEWEIRNDTSNYSDTIRRIDAASIDELPGIASELRSKPWRSDRE